MAENVSGTLRKIRLEIMVSIRSLGTRSLFALLLMGSAAVGLAAEVCTTQSQMKPAEKEALLQAATGLATKMQAGDAPGLRSLSVAEVAKDFASINEVVQSTAPRIKGASVAVEQMYLLDASTLKPAAGATTADAQFYCTLNRSAAEADFLIPGLPPGRYAFVIAETQGVAAPWRLPFLLRQEQGRWLMAGLYPKPMTTAGHDGLWYWTAGRQMVASKQPWNAWLDLEEAASLLQPAGFVQSSHLEKLRAEITSAAPPALSEGISVDTPLVVKGKDGTEYRFTALDLEDSPSGTTVDVAAHLKTDAVADQASARRRNIAAMTALLQAYPEMRKPFHGVWMYSDTPAQGTYPAEQAMSDIP